MSGDQDQGLTRRLAAGGLALAATGLGRAFAAARFPSRPLTIMAPANPGGGWDQLARIMQLVIREEGLVPVPLEVLNRGGAGGLIGLAELITRRHGDPYMVMATGSVMIGSTIANASPFKTSDTIPLARLFSERLIVAVPANSPYRSVQELVEAFAKDPDAISWSGGSAGGIDHILAGLIAEAAGVSAKRVRFVAYSGGGEAASAVMGGQVAAAVSGYGEWKGLADAGHVKILATASAERFGDRKIPTLRESGLPVTIENWRGVVAPPGMEEEQLAWWVAVLEKMRNSKRWQDYLAANDRADTWLTRGDFHRFIREDEAVTTKTLARLGIGGEGQGGSYAVVGPWAFPTAIGIAGAAAVAAVAVQKVTSPGVEVAPAAAEDDDEPAGPPPVWKRFLAGAALSLAYIAALATIGFLVSTPVFVVALCWLMGSRKWLRDAAAGVALSAGVWLLFTRLLSVSLP